MIATFLVALTIVIATMAIGLDDTKSVSKNTKEILKQDWWYILLRIVIVVVIFIII